MKRSIFAALVFALLISGNVFSQENFLGKVGAVRVGNIVLNMPSRPAQVPFIFWGGDMFTFYANGTNLKTQPGSIYAQLGVNIELVPGDDLYAQTRGYLEGKYPFFRGTFGMLGGFTAEAMAIDPRTTGFCLFQETWSQGDHCVGREGIKTIDQFKGQRKIRAAINDAGPHPEVLFTQLANARMTLADVELVLCPKITGKPDDPTHPAGRFRTDKTIDICWAVTPDMIGLCGGLNQTGTGADNTVLGAHVIESTAYMSFALMDGYRVRTDVWQKYPDFATNFVAGYLRAVEEVLDMVKVYESTKKRPAKLEALLKMAVEVWPESLPNNEEAYGLLMDAKPVGHPGNVSFFRDPTNTHGFKTLSERSLAMAKAYGYVKNGQLVATSPIDWNSKAFDILKMKQIDRSPRIRAELVIPDIEQMGAGLTSKDLIQPFTIEFTANSSMFVYDTAKHGSQFDQIFDYLSTHGNAMIVLRAHSDATALVAAVAEIGLKNRVLTRTGVSGNYSYYLDSKSIPLYEPDAIPILIRAIEDNRFAGVTSDKFGELAGMTVREIYQSGVTLSKTRAESAKTALTEQAKKRNINVEESQIQTTGVGPREPLFSVKAPIELREKNMRVEVRLWKVPSEMLDVGQIDF